MSSTIHIYSTEYSVMQAQSIECVVHGGHGIRAVCVVSYATDMSTMLAMATTTSTTMMTIPTPARSGESWRGGRVVGDISHTASDVVVQVTHPRRFKVIIINLLTAGIVKHL